MEKDTRVLPVAANSSSGFGGVAARFSILDEAEARQGSAVGHAAASQPSADGVGREGADAMRNGSVLAARALEPLQAFNATLAETARGNFEGALRLFQDLAAAKGPLDLLSIQAKYSGRQFHRFSQQVEDIHCAFLKLFASMATPTKAKFLHTISASPGFDEPRS
jgi:hypothetical protein